MPPLRKHELVLLFYKKLPSYNPQGLIALDKPIHAKKRISSKNVYRDNTLQNPYTQTHTNYPTSILTFSNGKVVTEYRLAEWAQIIQRRQGCGKSIKDFCETEGISKNTYFYWQRKLRESACTELSKRELNTGTTDIIPSGWTRIEQAKPQQEESLLTIEVNGYQITFRDSVDMELLSKVC